MARVRTRPSGLHVVTRSDRISAAAAARADEIAAEIQGAKARPGWLARRRRKVTIYDGAGRPVAGVDVDDWGNSHHEIGLDRVDATARPAPVHIRINPVQPGGTHG